MPAMWFGFRPPEVGSSVCRAERIGGAEFVKLSAGLALIVRHLT
jgi:hypothetical protein